MYWSIGTRINQDILGGKRAEPAFAEGQNAELKREQYQIAI